jgi:hypothetical protein
LHHSTIADITSARNAGKNSGKKMNCKLPVLKGERTLKKINTIAKTVLVPMLLSGFAGCSMTRNVTLVYPPGYSGAGAQSSGSKKAAKTARKGKIILKAFKDNRTVKDKIGHMENAFGKDMGSRILTDDDVVQWVTRAIKFELKKRGFEVMPDTNPPALLSEPVLSGTLIKAYTTSYFTYQGDVEFTADFTLGSTTLLTKHYFGNGDNGTFFVAKAEGFGGALSLALQDAAGNLAKDIDKTLASRKIMSAEPEKSVFSKPDSLHLSPAMNEMKVNFDSICGLNQDVFVISGKRSPDLLMKRISEQDSVFKKLYLKRLNVDPNEKGDVFVFVEIYQNGSMGRDSVVKSYIGDTLLEQQIVNTIKRIPYRALRAGTDTSMVVYKIHFEKKRNNQGRIAIGILMLALSFFIIWILPGMIRTY